MSAPVLSDVCVCGHWSRHHTVGKRGACGHCPCKGFSPENAPDLRQATDDLAGRLVSQEDQVRAMTDGELSAALYAGRYTTIEIFEAARRLAGGEDTGMSGAYGFVCPHGHLHHEGSAFCTVCGAGPVLARESPEWHLAKAVELDGNDSFPHSLTNAIERYLLEWKAGAAVERTQE